MKYTIDFFLDKEKNKSNFRIRCRTKWNGHIVNFLVGHRVEPEKWSTETQQCKRNTTHGKRHTPANIINKDIANLRNIITTIFDNTPQESLTPDYIKQQVNFRLGKIPQQPLKTITIADALDIFINETSTKNSWSNTTYKRFHTIKTQFQENYPQLTANQINEQFLTKYVEERRYSAQNKDSSIKKYLAGIKQFLKWAYKNEYTTNTDFQNFEPSFKIIPKPIIFLDWDELQHLYNAPLPTEALRRIRDTFCFCCFSSLRYSDVSNLKRSDIFSDHIQLTSVKTHENLIIELNDYTREILNRYQHCDFPNNRALPVTCSKRMNEAIRTIGKLCGFDTPIRISYYVGRKRIDEVKPKYELMTTHCGRKTFICNALMLGISPNVVMKWTGHSDYQAMKPYIEISDKSRQKAMTLFNKH